MQGLAGLYDRLLRVLGGCDSSVLVAATVSHLVRTATRFGYDGVLGRQCQHGSGFMVDLAHHAFSRLHSPGSFGHTGFNAMTFAGADPRFQLSYAVHLNAAPSAETAEGDPDRSPWSRRRLISDALVRAAMKR